MKRILPLILFCFSVFAFSAVAQTTVICNANFTWNSSGNTAKFIPDVIGDTPYVRHYWSFGDGHYSDAISPYNTYPAAGGTFTVTHYQIKRNPNGVELCRDSVTKEITFQQDCVVPQFTYAVDASNYLTIKFTNTSYSINANDSISWMFGDGTHSGDINATHTYTSAGVYKVCLLIKKRSTTSNTTSCVREVCTEITIVKPCDLKVDFNWQKDPAISNKVYFANATLPLNTSDSLYWSFGDGTYSKDWNPAHVYSQSGTYTVCLKVKRKKLFSTDPECSQTFCKTIEIVTPACTIVPDFTWVANATLNTRINFTNATAGLTSTDSVRWSFGDGTYSTEVNPAHTFSQAGNYTVCLRIIKRNSSAQLTGCIKDTCKTITVVSPCDFVPSFTWVTDSSNTLKIKFTNTTLAAGTGTNVLTTWIFGDTSAAVTGWNVTHEYSQPGKYYVCLRVQLSATCVKYKCDSITLANPPVPCDFVPGYTWKKDSLNNKKIYFTNTTVPPTTANISATWSFGDGSANVTSWSATHEYTQPGKYYVCVRIQSGSNCVKYKCDSITVTVPPPPCDFVPTYTWKKDSVNNKKIYFTNTTILPTITNINGLATWSFGDGSANVTSWNATHEYVQTGKYYVCLRIEYGSGCVKYKCDSITITVPPPPCDFVPTYSWVKDATNSKKINFTNTTVLPTTGVSAIWSFGDGSANATSWNAIHEYAQAGKYYVCLRVEYGIGCVKYKCDSVTVTVPPPPINCSQLSLFTYQPSSVNQLYYFIPANQSNDIQYTWTFGDGMGSHDVISSHQFAEYGTYQVCLTAYKNTNCASTTCKAIKITPPVNCDTVKLSYSYRRDQYMSNKIYFYAVSNVPVQQQTWTIFKPGSSNSITVNQNNPMYSFTDTGYYYVCLKAVTNGGCVKEYCSAIQIESISTRCELQAIPNPVTNQVNVTVQMDAPELIHAYIYNIQNVLVQQKDQQGLAGNNVVSINTETLVAGYYTIKLIYGNKVCFAKFQKL
ncbi:PKD domain-containing protein [Ferruginibacter lapsinanis]|uniref:PKD domain-containing protein n=1 Tax=Ferruginibacter lapsinanis TaxID=563172 RepID=UPI001E6591B4|nr:PKD domain-containing protein [Ferruginibacter lapsinanis]UEG50516.1 PKD domain-containing protein [Ferruginibacter lapsinanis]